MCLLQKVQVRCRIWLTVTGYILEMDSNFIEYSFRIHLQKNSPTFDKMNAMEEER